MTDELKVERDAFEREAKHFGLDLSRNVLHGDHYRKEVTEFAWGLWRDRQALRNMLTRKSTKRMHYL